MHVFDYSLILFYFILVAFVGGRFYCRKETASQYLLADRSVHWLPAAITILATTISGITFIGMPAQSFKSDLRMFQIYLPVPIVALIVSATFIPLFYRARVFTAYEWLEGRFDLKTRLLGSGLFQLIRGFNLGTVLYVPALAISEILHVSLLWAVIFMGVVTTIYTVLGGIRGVIWTDILQAAIFLIGPFLTLLLIAGRVDGGALTLFDLASRHDKLRMFDFSWNLNSEFTFWGAFLSAFFLQMALQGASQVQVQKYLAATSEKNAARVLIVNGFASLLTWFLFFVVGIALYAFYVLNPGRLPSGINPDSVFLRFIVFEMPTGIRGLLIAGVLAAAMSSFSSFLISLCSTTVADFYRRLRRSDTPEVKTIRFARRVTLAWGVYGMLAALSIPYLGTVLEVTMRINNLLYGCILGIFLLGMYTRRSNGFGAFSGGLVSVATVMAYSLFTRYSWLWTALIGTATSFAAGYLFSLAALRFEARRIRLAGGTV